MVPILAHAGAPVAPHDLLTTWPADPPVWVVLAASALLYAVGAVRLRSDGPGRRALPGWRVAAAAAALVAAALAVASPLEPLSGTLFAAHMVQHELLVLLVAPLVVLSRPLLVTAMALPARHRRRALGLLRTGVRGPATWSPAVLATLAVVAHTATFWVWHLPPLYRAAIASEPLHVLEHATMVAGALPLFWLALDARRRHADGAVVLGLLVAAIQSSALAGMLTFARQPLYDLPTDGLAAWGLTAITDQQAAGGLMWFPGGLAYLIVGAVAFLRWMRADERIATPERRPSAESPTWTST